jgi:hypothetical protein
MSQEPDTAVIDCPVKCEGCSVVLPMAAALHTEDPVYLCGRCAADTVGHQERERAKEALRLAEEDRNRALEAVHARRTEAERQRDELRYDIENDVRLDEVIRQRDEVGVLLAAAQAELARVRPVVEAARLPVAYGVRDDAIRRAFAAHDAHPGLDAKPKDGA